MGLNVKNAADETIGEVEDLVLDMKDGKILAVVISSGCWLALVRWRFQERDRYSPQGPCWPLSAMRLRELPWVESLVVLSA